MCRLLLPQREAKDEKVRRLAEEEDPHRAAVVAAVVVTVRADREIDNLQRSRTQP